MYEIFQKLLDEMGLKVADVAKGTGIRNGVFSDWKMGRYTPKADKIKKVADFLGVSPEYLLGQADLKYANMSFCEGGVARIPVVGNVAAGYPFFANEEILDYEEIDERYLQQGKMFGLRIAGDSMEPEIKKGSVAIVRSQPDADSGDIVIVKINGDEATCKRLQKHSNGISLLSNNPSYTPVFFTANEVTHLPVSIVGKVLEVRTRYF